MTSIKIDRNDYLIGILVTQETNLDSFIKFFFAKFTNLIELNNSSVVRIPKIKLKKTREPLLNYANRSCEIHFLS